MGRTSSRQQRIEVIGRCLGVLSYEIQSGNLAGLTSLNVIAEDILCPILAMIFEAPDLASTNKAAPNSDTIDLYSSAKQLGIQITSDTSAGKVKSTLDGALAGQWSETLAHLKFLLLSPTVTKRDKSTRESWLAATPTGLEFDPNEDVVEGVPSLLKLIRPLSDEALSTVASLLDSSVFGHQYRDVAGCAAVLTANQLRYMQDIGKYIPDLYIEAKGAKDLARCFVHPVLFLGWTLDQLDQLDFEVYAKELALAGIGTLTLPESAALRASASYEDVIRAAVDLKASLEKLQSLVEAVHGGVYDKAKSLEKRIPQDRLFYYEEVKYQLYNRSWRLRTKLAEIIDALTCITARVLVFTTHAGQGKTMFTCDVVSRTLQGHGVTAAFLTGHYASQQGDVPFHTVLERLLFGTSELTANALLTLLNDYAHHKGKPFVIVIDGLNEHNRISQFAGQLHRLIADSAAFPFVRFFLTCRSEFFDTRFSVLAGPPVKDMLFRTDEIESSFDAKMRSEMVEQHLDYFEIAPYRVSGEVRKDLERDRILLRLFCEAYSPNGGDSETRFIPSLYRREVFGKYLSQRLCEAARLFHESTGEPIERARRRLGELLAEIADRMLTSGTYSQLPIDQMSAANLDVLDYLLGEEILLRRDLSPTAGILPSLTETVTFTFDEFRDYLLAERLGTYVFQNSPDEFDRLAKEARQSAEPLAEGITRFLFHLARAPGNEKLYQHCESLGILQDAFIPEVFNSPPSDERADDVPAVKAILAAYESRVDYLNLSKDFDHAKQARAHAAAMILVRRWNRDVYPHLNLDVLLDVTEELDLGPINVVTSCFGWHDGFPLAASCRTLLGILLKEFEQKNDANAVSTIGRLLVVLLPMEDPGNMDTPAYQALDHLYQASPEAGQRVLLRGIEEGLTASRTYLWRLAAKHVMCQRLFDRLAPQATADSAVEGSRGFEARRFLEIAKARLSEGANEK
ncbi:MAG: hypothetical protein HONBIEJF_02558 [Fimbriimonadaceae bacterium]|nr:hypothetical protein [Fimbriimonadaceae bacterium]